MDGLARAILGVVLLWQHAGRPLRQLSQFLFDLCSYFLDGTRRVFYRTNIEHVLLALPLSLTRLAARFEPSELAFSVRLVGGVALCPDPRMTR